MCSECWRSAEPVYDKPESGCEDGEHYVRWDLTEGCCVVFANAADTATLLVNTTDKFIKVRIADEDLRDFGEALIELANEVER